VQRANALLSECISGAALATIDDAAHFMIATHPNEVGRLVARHAHSAEAMSSNSIAPCNSQLLTRKYLSVIADGSRLWP
jgi:hypothetical protein